MAEVSAGGRSKSAFLGFAIRGIRCGDASSKRQRDGCGPRCRQALSCALCAQDRLLASFHGKLDHLLCPIQRMIRSRCAPLSEKIEKSRWAHRGSSVWAHEKGPLTMVRKEFSCGTYARPNRGLASHYSLNSCAEELSARVEDELLMGGHGRTSIPPRQICCRYRSYNGK